MIRELDGLQLCVLVGVEGVVALCGRVRRWRLLEAVVDTWRDVKRTRTRMAEM